MKISAGDVFPTYMLHIEVDGVSLTNVVELDLKTGEAIVFKLADDGGLVRDADWNADTEKVTFPVDKLHVYLVKPK